MDRVSGRAVASEGRGWETTLQSASPQAGLSPCLRCQTPIPVRRMGCRGGHCPNCGHPYPHGDCSD